MTRLKSRDQCGGDFVALEEVMLRLPPPGESRIRAFRQFKAWEGGGEYNVVRGLRRCIDQRMALGSVFVDKEVDRPFEGLILQGGVDISHVQRMPFDGVGHRSRNGLNITERGFSLRPAKCCSDRGQTAVSQLSLGDVDLERIFVKYGARRFHTGRIFTALLGSTARIAQKAMVAASEAATIKDSCCNRKSLGLSGKNIE